MANQTPPFDTPELIHHARWCRNGEPVLYQPMGKIASAYNWAAAYRGKGPLIQRSRDMPAMGSGAAGPSVLWRWYGWSGYGQTTLRTVVLAKPADNSAAADPYVLVSVTDSGGTNTGEHHFVGFTSSSTPAPSVLTMGVIDITVVENSALECVISEVDYLRIVSVCSFLVGTNPVSDTGTAGVSPGSGVGSPILDAMHLDMATAATGMWTRNAAHIFTWAADGTANSPTRSNSATYRNILDSSSTSVTAATPGMRLQHGYHNRVTAETVPTRLAVYAVRTSGAGDTSKNAVRVSDGTNTVTVTGIGNSAGWYTADATIPSSGDAKYDIMARTSTVADGGAADAIRVDAVSWLEYV